IMIKSNHYRYGGMDLKRGAIFDMDGTLLDTEKYYAQGWLAVAEEFGLERNTALPAAMSGSSASAMPEILHTFYPEVDARAYIDKVIAFVKESSERHLALMPGALEILQYLQSQDVRMAVASSSRRAVIEEKLQRVDLLKYFSAIIGGDDVEKGKPDPEIFIKAASAIKVPPKECYAFEDSFNGVRAAHASGALTIMVPDQVPPTEEIRRLCTVQNSLLQAMQSIREGKL
ncbi:MAG: HAD family hydrolase, partial [Selenomonadaceae bacterium]|nr:HAD family hydrolase [Selenomonadaceae bacterium]